MIENFDFFILFYFNKSKNILIFLKMFKTYILFIDFKNVLKHVLVSLIKHSQKKYGKGKN